MKTYYVPHAVKRVSHQLPERGRGDVAPLFVMNEQKTLLSSGRRNTLIWPVTILIGIAMVCRAWLKNEKAKIRHDRNVRAVEIAFTQTRLRIPSSKLYRSFVYDVNSMLHPLVGELLFRRLIRFFYKIRNLLKYCFNLLYAFFKFKNSLFQDSSSFISETGTVGQGSEDAQQNSSHNPVQDIAGDVS